MCLVRPLVAAVLMALLATACDLRPLSLQEKLIALATDAGTTKVLAVFIEPSEVAVELADTRWVVRGNGIPRREELKMYTDDEPFDIREIKATSLTQIDDAMQQGRGRRPARYRVTQLSESGAPTYKALDGRSPNAGLRMDLSPLGVEKDTEAGMEAILQALLPKCGEQLRRLTVEYRDRVTCTTDRATYAIDGGSLPHRWDKEGDASHAPLAPAPLTGATLLRVRNAARQASTAERGGDWTLEVHLDAGQPRVEVGFADSSYRLLRAVCDLAASCRKL